jgi:hypothetical protein
VRKCCWPSYPFCLPPVSRRLDVQNSFSSIRQLMPGRCIVRPAASPRHVLYFSTGVHHSTRKKGGRGSDDCFVSGIPLA